MNINIITNLLNETKSDIVGFCLIKELTTILTTVLILCCYGLAYGQADIGQRQRQLRQVEAGLGGDEAYTEFNQPIANLSEYIKVGLRRNPGVKAAFYRWKAAFEEIARQFSLPDPQFSYTEYIDEVETRVGPQQRAFSLKQKFPFGDKLWIRKTRAFKASEVAYYNFQDKVLDLNYSISQAYYEYAYLSKAILLTRENMKLLGNFESVAQAKYASGLAKNQDLLKVQVELGKLENDLYSLEDLRSALVARLNALLNLPRDNVLPWPDEPLEGLSLSEDYKDMQRLWSRLTQQNPQLLGLSEDIEKNRQALRLARREFLPDVTLGVTQVSTGEALNPATADSGKDPLMVMFSVNLPVWAGRVNAGIEQADAALAAAQKERQDKENELSSRLSLVHYKLRDALRQSRMYKDGLLPKATQTLNATKSGYEAGNVDFLSLIDAQRVLLAFQLAYYRHNANFYQRLAELKSLLGKDGEW